MGTENLEFDKSSLIKLINYHLVNDDRKPINEDDNYEEYLEELFDKELIDLKIIVFHSPKNKYLDIQITRKGYELINTVQDFLRTKKLYRNTKLN